MQRWLVAHTSRDRSGRFYHHHRSPESSEFFDRSHSRRRISFADPISLSRIVRESSASGKLPHFSRSRSLPNGNGRSQLLGVRNLHDVKDPARKPSSEPAGRTRFTQPEDTRDSRKDLRRFIRLVDRIILKHYELEQEQQKLQYCELYLQQSTDAFTAAVDLAIDGVNLEASRNSLVDLRSRMKSDSNAFRAQTLRLQTMRTTISTLESRLKQKGGRLAQVLDVEDSTNARFFTADPDGETTPSTLSAQSSTPSLLAAYYERKGMVGVYCERLEELEYNYREGLDARELHLTGLEDPEISDAEYYTNYTAQRQAITDALENVKQETAELVAKCQSAGIPIPQLRPERACSAISTAPESLFVPDSPISDVGALYRETSELSNSKPVSPRRDNSVIHWLDDLSTAAIDSSEVLGAANNSSSLPKEMQSQCPRHGKPVSSDEESFQNKDKGLGGSDELDQATTGVDLSISGAGAQNRAWDRLQCALRHLFSRKQTV